MSWPRQIARVLMAAARGDVLALLWLTALPLHAVAAIVDRVDASKGSGDAS